MQQTICEIVLECKHDQRGNDDCHQKVLCKDLPALPAVAVLDAQPGRTDVNVDINAKEQPEIVGDAPVERVGGDVIQFVRILFCSIVAVDAAYAPRDRR